MAISRKSPPFLTGFTSSMIMLCANQLDIVWKHIHEATVPALIPHSSRPLTSVGDCIRLHFFLGSSPRHYLPINTTGINLDFSVCTYYRLFQKFRNRHRKPTSIDMDISLFDLQILRSLLIIEESLHVRSGFNCEAEGPKHLAHRLLLKMCHIYFIYFIVHPKTPRPPFTADICFYINEFRGS